MLTPISRATKVSTAPAPEVLSEREIEFLVMVAQGLTYHSIVSLMKIAKKTIDTHRIHILRKLGLCSNVDMTRYALFHQLVTLDGAVGPACELAMTKARDRIVAAKESSARKRWKKADRAGRDHPRERRDSEAA